jgi:hypothetical protein
VQVVVVSNIGVKTLGAAEYLHHVHHPDVGKGQQRAVDRIKRDVRKRFIDSPEHQIRCGVLFRLNENPENGYALGRNFKLVAAAGFHKKLHTLIDRCVLHVALK